MSVSSKKINSPLAPTAPKKIDSDNTPQVYFDNHGALVNYRDSWKIFSIMAEFVAGYQFLGKFKRGVTILGSARLAPNHRYYKVAEKLGKLLGGAGFTVVTGGGPGIMEAANKGAMTARGGSVGLNIDLPSEQHLNPYVKDSVGFHYFFTRKVMLTAPGNAYVFFPGGFGTLDEFFELVDYMEMGQMDKAPIVLVGKSFWEPLIYFLKEHSVGELSAAASSDIDTWHIVETAEEAFEFVKDVKDRPQICNDDPHNPLCVEGTDWKLFRIMGELVAGFEFLSKINHDVTVLGTRSISPQSPYYEAAYAVGKVLAERQFTTITGGGPGIMEAANKGAHDNGGLSIGITMRFENGSERVNNYLTKSLGFFFPFIRKLIITAPSEAFIFFPGGFGTLHQLFELLTLQETKKMEPYPIILYGSHFWQPLLQYIHTTLHAEFNTISQVDEELIKMVNKPEEVGKYLHS